MLKIVSDDDETLLYKSLEKGAMPESLQEEIHGLAGFVISFGVSEDTKEEDIKLTAEVNLSIEYEVLH